MSYILSPSLQHIALVKIATALWNQDDVRTLTRKLDFQQLCKYCSHHSYREEEWEVVQNKVIEKVPELPLPRTVKSEILDFIEPIGLKILNWKDYLESVFETDFVRETLNQICWTPHGTIDKRRTAKTVIDDENLDISMRYKIACIYCLEKDVLTLWNKMPEYRKAFFYSEDPKDVEQPKLVAFWTYDIRGKMAKMGYVIESSWRKCSPYQYAFETSADDGNKAATEHFLGKLNPKERAESLVRSAENVAVNCMFLLGTDLPKEDYTEVLCFLLSQMSDELQLEVFKGYPYEVLMCFLNWPYQSFYMLTANRIWDLITKDDFYSLLCVIVDNRIVTWCKDYTYQKLFRDFWLHSPTTHKGFVVGKCASGALLLRMLQPEDKEIFKLILEETDAVEREEIFISYYVKCNSDMVQSLCLSEGF